MTTTNSQDKRLFASALVLLTILGLLAIWYPRFPPMQDYPQSLFMAHVLSSFADPALNWSEHYAANQHLGPYSLFFVIVGLFAKVVPVEIAGKLFISLALCLTAFLALAWNRAHAPDHPAWSALLLFPLLFSQVYYMGFVNYLISIPVLFLALLVHEKFIRHDRKPGTIISYLALLLLLLLAHPYTILVFLILSFVITLFSSDSGKKIPIGLIGPIAIAILFVLWYLSTFGVSPSQGLDTVRIRWWPLRDVAGYFSLPFVGMRITNGPDLLTLLAWSIIAALFLVAGIHQKQPLPFRSPVFIMLLLSLAGYAILPFWLGDYSYFNLRMSIVCYFLLALALGNIRLGRWSRYALVILVCSIMLMTLRTHLALSAETEELLPLFDRMKQNATVGCVDIGASPAAIDRHYFYQFHTHDHFYYHVVVGGGAAATLFDSKMNPIRVKEGIAMPDIFRAPQFYQYILVRGRLPWEQLFANTHRTVAQSGSWRLYERYNPLRNAAE
ncbi:MAG TPA: hypothetical protein VIX18_00370 [Nitrospirota bacterium]